MEVDFFSYKLDARERFFYQSVLFFLLALGLSLAGNYIVYADPSSRMPFEGNYTVPSSKRTFESSGQWRAPEQPKNKWRESEESEITIQNDRMKKKSSSIYDTPQAQDNWDPYASPGSGNNSLTKPAKVFEFRF